MKPYPKEELDRMSKREIIRLYKRTVEQFNDAEPVIHAHWEYVDYGGVGSYHCSNCRAISETQYNGLEPIPKLTKYCPNCGAKMDGKENEQN